MQTMKIRILIIILKNSKLKYNINSYNNNNI